jgi:hypothetical protein
LWLTSAQEGVELSSLFIENGGPLLSGLDSGLRKSFVPLLEQFGFLKNVTRRVVQPGKRDFRSREAHHESLLQEKNPVLGQDRDPSVKVEILGVEEADLLKQRGS